MTHYTPGNEFLCVEDLGDTSAGRGDNAGRVMCCCANTDTSSTAVVTPFTTELTYSGDNASADVSSSSLLASARKLTAVISSHNRINVANAVHRRFTALVNCGDRLQYGFIAGKSNQYTDLIKFY